MVSIFSVANLGEPDREWSEGWRRDDDLGEKGIMDVDGDVEEEIEVPREKGEGNGARLVAVNGLNRPYFHVDLQEALEAAIESVERGRMGR